MKRKNVPSKVAKHPKKRKDYIDDEPPVEEPKRFQVILEIEPISEADFPLDAEVRPATSEDNVRGPSKLSAAKRAKQYVKGTLHVDPDSGQLFCTTCDAPVDHTHKGSIDKHLNAASHLRRGGKPSAEVKRERTDVEDGESSSSRDAWCVAMKTALNVSCEDRVAQYPEGTLHVDEESGLLYCSSCLIPVDHSRKGTIDKHLKSRTHVDNSRRVLEDGAEPKRRAIPRVNSFQKPHSMKRKKTPGRNDEDSDEEQETAAKTNQVAKAAINVTPADRVEQYPAGMLHAEANQLFCSACNISLDHTRKGSIDKHLKTRLHSEKSKRLEEQRSKKQATVTAAFAKTTEARDARNLALYQLVEAFTAAEIPLKKLEHPKLRQYLMENVANLGALPHFSTLRTGYLPKVLENLRAEKQQRLAALDEIIDTVAIDSLSYLIEN